MSVEFCDTNILVYAHDLSAGEKRVVATALLDRLSASGDGAISTQVLQELYVNLTRKVKSRLTSGEARDILVGLTNWPMATVTSADILDAVDGAVRWQVSFWDGLILTCARKVGASILWTEDLNDGQSYDSVVVRNPFRS